MHLHLRDCENDGCFEGDENAGWNEGAMMEVIGNDKRRLLIGIYFYKIR